MILKKKEFFLLIFLFLLQSCSGGRLGNFLESSFSDLENVRQNDYLQKNLVNKKIKQAESPKSVLENIKDKNLEKIQNEKNKKIKQAESPKSVLENIKDKNLEKIQNEKNKKIKNSLKKRKIELQSYRIIFLLKDVDPKDPTEDLSTILRNSEVNFEIEKIERIFESENKSMNKN